MDFAVTRAATAAAAPGPDEAASRPSLREIDAMSAEQLTVLVVADPGQRRRVERRLVTQGRTGDVYALARNLDRTGAASGLGDGAVPPLTAAEIDALVDANTAEKLEKIVQRLERRIMAVLWTNLVAVFTLAQTSVPRAEVARDTLDDRSDAERIRGTCGALEKEARLSRLARGLPADPSAEARQTQSRRAPS